MAILRGVDGCPKGWLCLTIDGNGGDPTARIFNDAATLLLQAADVITIDIPIGIASAGTRRCDEEARALLGDRKSSVFPAPVRSALTTDSYESACLASRAACGKALSQQSYALLPKIRDVDGELQRMPRLLESAREVHPEVCFYFWNGKRPMRFPKKTGFGFMERFRLVDSVFPGAATAVRDAIPRSDAADDDILDAFAALWTAKRIHADVAVRLPVVDQRDDRGLPMHIWA